MIYDSFFWKEKLNKQLKSAKVLLSAKNLNEKKLNQLEYFSFTSAFCVRKLIDSNKLSNYCKNYSIKVKQHNCIKMPDFLNRDNIDTLYNIIDTIESSINIKGLCNLLIHSYCFIFGYDENDKIESFFVNSDYHKNKNITCVLFIDWIKYLELVISDDICEVSLKRDSTGEFITLFIKEQD